MSDAELQATVAAVRGALYFASYDEALAPRRECLALCDAVERLTAERDAAREALAGLLNATTENVGFQATVRAVAKANNVLAQLNPPAPPRGEEG